MDHVCTSEGGAWSMCTSEGGAWSMQVVGSILECRYCYMYLFKERVCIWYLAAYNGKRVL